MKIRPFLTLVALSAFNLQLANTADAQGSLTPPGAPAPTMKTLDQVEARTPVDTAHTPGDADSLFVISQPGSYYLTGSITGVAAKHGIKITASYVTLDLNGFSLTAAAGSLTGIHVPSATPGLSVSNGVISGWGQNGVGATTAADSMYDRLRVSGNGAAGAGYSGLTCQSGCMVTDCSFENNTGNGLTVQAGSTVTGVVSQNNTQHWHLRRRQLPCAQLQPSVRHQLRPTPDSRRGTQSTGELLKVDG